MFHKINWETTSLAAGSVTTTLGGGRTFSLGLQNNFVWNLRYKDEVCNVWLSKLNDIQVHSTTQTSQPPRGCFHLELQRWFELITIQSSLPASLFPLPSTLLHEINPWCKGLWRQRVKLDETTSLSPPWGHAAILKQCAPTGELFLNDISEIEFWLALLWHNWRRGSCFPPCCFSNLKWHYLGQKYNMGKTGAPSCLPSWFISDLGPQSNLKTVKQVPYGNLLLTKPIVSTTDDLTIMFQSWFLILGS